METLNPLDLKDPLDLKNPLNLKEPLPNEVLHLFVSLVRPERKQTETLISSAYFPVISAEWESINRESDSATDLSWIVRTRLLAAILFGGDFVFAQPRYLKNTNFKHISK